MDPDYIQRRYVPKIWHVAEKEKAKNWKKKKSGTSDIRKLTS